MIRVYDDAGNVIETHEHVGDFNDEYCRSALRLPSTHLAHVIDSPKRLQIAVVEGDCLLFRLGQIERA